MIKRITKNRKRYLELLLLGDEQESMIDRYLERGEMFALFDGELKTVCVVTDEGGGVCELKNIATVPDAQGMGYGKQMLTFLGRHYRPRFKKMLVGTGDSPLTVPFYLKCGFHESHRVKNFFTENYDHPIFEDDIQLVDMVYFSKEL